MSSVINGIILLGALLTGWWVGSRFGSLLAVCFGLAYGALAFALVMFATQGSATSSATGAVVAIAALVWVAHRERRSRVRL